MSQARRGRGLPRVEWTKSAALYGLAVALRDNGAPPPGDGLAVAQW